MECYRLARPTDALSRFQRDLRQSGFEPCLTRDVQDTTNGDSVAMPSDTRYAIRTAQLPRQPTPFIGRSQELAEIADLLTNPTCRLLTLIGPGGIGKTRLALEAASRSAAIVDRVVFVTLQSVPDRDMIVPTIAESLQFALSGSADPRVQLLNFLRDKNLLLVIDNFEHVLDGVDLLTDLLQAAPELKLLVTSREVLNVQEEWLYSVRGMDVPPNEDSGDSAHYSAVQLFVERARRVRHNFVLADEQQAVGRICQLVEGMPLAIELAAAWTRTLPCAAIATEIEHNLAFLTTNLRNIPERHRSMRAVFDHSWKLLSAEEQQVFRCLSIFRGSFQYAAAAQVASASLSILAALVDKSLLRSDTDGRYQIHELLRQFAEEQLNALPEEAARTRAQHCAYYADFLAARTADMSGGRQREATIEINAELANIRAAWQCAVEEVNVEAIHKCYFVLDLFYTFRSRYREDADLLGQAAHCLQHAPPTDLASITLGSILIALGYVQIRLGQLEQARNLFEQGQALHARFSIPQPPGPGYDSQLGLGLLAMIQGDYAEAARFGAAMLRLSEMHQHTANLPYAWYLLANAALAQGQYETAQHYAQQAYAAVQVSQDRWFMAYCLNDLGQVACALGKYAEARQHYQASYAIREEFDDSEGMAVALNRLGHVAIRQQDYAEAQHLYERSLAIYQQIGDRGGLATALNGLGVTACGRGAYAEARQAFSQALTIASDIRYIPLILTLLTNASELLLHAGSPEWAVELLVFTLRHPASDRETNDRAQHLLIRGEAACTSDVFASATQRGQLADLDTVVARLLVELAALEAQAITGSSAGPVSASPGLPVSQSLVEPLTEREREVLQLIADGLSNQAIADELVISVGTVKWYTRQIYGKLGVQTRTQAVARARAVGLLG